MFVKPQLVWATTVAAATLVAACNGGPESAKQSPTAPSATETSAGNATNALTETQAAALTASCRFGSGDVVITPGPPPPGESPGTPGTPPSGGTSPGGSPRPPEPGTQLALGAVMERRAGDCPAITFTIGGRTIRTNVTTSFGGGSCAALENGDQVGAMGTAQADGSIVASCVAAGG